MATTAAGVLLLAANGTRALFLRRAEGLWAFPGGCIEDGETAEQAAEREVREEIGPAPHGELTMLMRRVKDDVDFTTFAAKTSDEFIPALNTEHTAWCWANIDDPPQPLHPGATAALAKLNADELGIARLMASGDLVSPQRYGSFTLWSIRITGTGYAYRDACNEYCYRPAELYLNDEFLARIAGLPVVFVHPKKEKLDSQEYHDRNVGSVFIPFIKGDEVWAVCRIYDDDANTVLSGGDFSTSPGVVLAEDGGGIALQLKDGTKLLVEGNAALVDHIALVPAGVWDKGGEPSGVDATGVTMADDTDKGAEMGAKLDAITELLKNAHSRMDAMEKEREDSRKDAARRVRMDAHRKDRFGARKDGEAHKDWMKRHDADESAMCDALRKDGASEEEAREDAGRARKDAEEREAKEGGESFKKWADEGDREPEHREREDRARKDAEAEEARKREEEERERRDAKHRHDAQATEIADLKRQLAALMTPVDANERNAIAAAQARADAVEGLFGRRASNPLLGESSLDYRRRLATGLKSNSPRFKEKNIGNLDADMLEMAEEVIYADAANAARSPDRAAPGVLIPIQERDEAGRTITRYTGDNMAWMQHFMSGARSGKFLDPRKRAA